MNSSPFLIEGVHIKAQGLPVPMVMAKNCKSGNFREGFIFAKLRIYEVYAKFRENKILAKWKNHSVVYL